MPDIMTKKEGEMIMESVNWLIENSKEGTPKIAIVSYVNNLLTHSYSHVKLRLTETDEIVFV
jgi:hypothetical protein